MFGVSSEKGQGFRVIGQVLLKKRGGVILHEAIFAKSCDVQTRILIKFPRVLSSKFHQSRSNLSF